MTSPLEDRPPLRAVPADADSAPRTSGAHDAGGSGAARPARVPSDPEAAAALAARRQRRAAALAAAPRPAAPGPGGGPGGGPEGGPEGAGAMDAATIRRRRRQRRGRRGAAVVAATVAMPDPQAARARPRHWGALASFVLLVLLPFAATTAYLWTRAADQYNSEVAFSIRSEESSSATAGLLGALTQIGSGSASDAAILHEYIRSQEIVAAVDAKLDLRAIWNRAGTGWRDGDPVFTLGDDPSIEALHRQWRRMVSISYDSTAGIIEITARAFTPEDAQAVAREILVESSALVNTLADQAREDAVRFARDELSEARENLSAERGALAEFRRRHSLVDPSADVAGQSGLLNALNAELAQALVDRDVLTSYASEGDQRVVQADRRIAAITERIEDERATLGVTGVAGSLPEVVGRYEELAVDLQFANEAYTQALGGLAAARAEARRQSRYLAAHVRPTLATTSLYPRRLMLTGLTGFFLMLGWSTLMLIYYNVRDSR